MRRVAIVGTAGSYREAPYQDPSVEIWGLNDGYMVKGGFPRADAWYDLHPTDHFFLAPDKLPDGTQPMVYAHDVPFGYYVRPTGHLDWLASQPFPVWLHPDHATQHPASAEWPTARAFPKAEIEAHFGRYFGSTPSWMLAHAIVQGVRDIEVYGIHLATESEYIDQRPNFEFLCGCLLGAGKRTMTVADGKRIYESAEGRLVLPVASPVLDAKFQYAFQPSPRRKADPIQWQMHKAQVKKQRRVAALMNRRLGLPWVTFDEPNAQGVPVRRRALASSLQQEIQYYDALLADYSDQLKIAMDTV
jgi:hypothetical protein